ncbi:MAG: ATP-binding protein [Evtepia gabavorous]
MALLPAGTAAVQRLKIHAGRRENIHFSGRRNKPGDCRYRHRIAPEDLPRVFEKGFTGNNGRMDKKATGIGLYLCRRVTNLLGHTISIASEPGVGTQVLLGLGRPQFDIE